MSVIFYEPTLEETICMRTTKEWVDRSTEDLTFFVRGYEDRRSQMSTWQKILRATVGDFERGEYWAAKAILKRRENR